MLNELVDFMAKTWRDKASHETAKGADHPWFEQDARQTNLTRLKPRTAGKTQEFC
jgi:hypothetical protein